MNIEELITKGNSSFLDKNIKPNTVFEKLGDPNVLSPEQDGYPLMLIYKNMEFWFHNDRIANLSIRFTEEDKGDTLSKLGIHQYKQQKNRSFAKIEKLLNDNNISWEKDTIMPDDYQENYISEKNVHFVFKDHILIKIVIDFDPLGLL